MTNTLTVLTHNDRLSVYDRMLAQKKPASREKYRRDLATFEEFVGIDLRTATAEDWKTFDPALLSAYKEWLSQVTYQRGKNSPPRQYTGSTINGKMTAVRELLKEASYFGLVDPDKLAYIRDRVLKTEKVSNVHHPTIAREDIDKILATAAKQPPLKNFRDYALFRLWLDTGLRRAELANLRVKDLAIEAGAPTLVVRRGKGDRSRKIQLTWDTTDHVRRWLAAAELTEPDMVMFCQLRKSGRGPAARYVVPRYDHPNTKNDPRYKPLSGPSINNLVAWYKKEAGIKSDFSCHSFRVQMVTVFLRDGAPLQHVQKVGGWTTSRMATEIYDRNEYTTPIGQFRKDPLPDLADLAAAA